MSVYRYWYLGPLKTYAAHWFSTLRVGIHSNVTVIFFLVSKNKAISEIKREIHATAPMFPSFRNGLWSGIFPYPTWLPP